MKVIHVFVVGIAVFILLGTLILYDLTIVNIATSEQQMMEYWQELMEYVGENTEYYERFSVFALSRDYNNKTELYNDMKEMPDYEEIWSVIAKQLVYVENCYDSESDIRYLLFRYEVGYEWACKIIYCESYDYTKKYDGSVRINNTLLITPLRYSNHGPTETTTAPTAPSLQDSASGSY